MFLCCPRRCIKALLQLHELCFSPLGPSPADRESRVAPLHFLWPQFQCDSKLDHLNSDAACH